MTSRNRRLRSRSASQARKQARGRIFHSSAPTGAESEVHETDDAIEDVSADQAA